MTDFDNDKLHAIAVSGDFGRDLAPHEVTEVIDYGISDGLLSDTVFWIAQGSCVTLGLALSDEVRVVSQELSLREFISPVPADTKAEAVGFVLSRVVELLEEVRDAVLGSRQADWRHTRVLGKGRS